MSTSASSASFSVRFNSWLSSIWPLKPLNPGVVGLHRPLLERCHERRRVTAPLELGEDRERLVGARREVALPADPRSAIPSGSASRCRR